MEDLHKWYPVYAGGVVSLVVAARSLGVDAPGGFVRKMTALQARVGDGVHGKTVDDVYVVVFMILSLFFARWLLTTCVFAPIANALSVARKKRDSFLEMGWQCVWYTMSFLASMYFVANEVGFDIDKCWIGQNSPPAENPHVFVSAEFKAFYLLEIAFWVSMIISTPLAPRQKDFPVMMAHHIVTSGLLIASYRYNYMYIGVWVLFEQDFADIFLPLAKMAKYCGMGNVADAFFAIFALAWIPTRHVMFFWLYHSIWTSTDVHADLLQLADSSKGGFFTKSSINAFLVVLGLFQCLLLIWLRDLLLAVHRALFKGSVEDHRSGSESEGDKKDR